jgi:hypothetical protein
VKGRLAVFVAVLVVAVGGSLFYTLYVHHRTRSAAAHAPKVPVSTDLAALQKVPHIVFRSTADGVGDGKAAVVSLADPGGPRAFTADNCNRVYARRGVAVCLVAKRGLATTYEEQIYRGGWTPTVQAPLPGLPSRARISPDGSLIATTTFVYGDSYTNLGQFSTRTIVSQADGSAPRDLESDFTLTVDGKVITAADKNIWGVTFKDDDTFYATAASGGHTWLVQGSLSGRTMSSLRGDVECPSISPDGTRIAFKKHGSLPAGQWHLAVYNLTTHTETLLAESRSVDDQVEWLDNTTVLYGLARGGGSSGYDVWRVPADGTGSPRVLVPDAFSPAVVP